MRSIRGGDRVEHALEVLERAVSELPEADRDQARRDTAAKLLRGAERKLAIKDAWQTWLDHRGKRTPGKATLAAYVGQWNRFARWAERNGIEFLHELDEFQALAYATDLEKSGVSPRTYNAHIKLLRSVFKTLATMAGLSANYWREIALLESETKGRRNLSPEELQIVCSRAQGTLRYLFGLGIYSGMRLGDCICLEWACVDFKAGIITYMPSKTKRKKKEIRLPVHPVLVALLHELRQSSQGRYLFPTERAIYQKEATTVSKMVQKFLKECGIETQEIVEGRKYAVCRVGFHSLRHSFVSLCALNKVPQAAVMELVGHGSPAMNRLYSHAGDAAKAAAVAALPTMDFDGMEKLEAPRKAEAN